MHRRPTAILAAVTLVLALALPAAAASTDRDDGLSFAADLWRAVVALVMPSSGAVEERAPAAPARPDLRKGGGDEGKERGGGGAHQRHWLQIEPGG